MMRSRRSSYGTHVGRQNVPAKRIEMRFLRNAAGWVRLVKLPRQYAFKHVRPNLKKASMAALIGLIGAGGGSRTHTPLAGPRILSPVRLPVPPPRHLDTGSGTSRFYRNG